MRPWTLLELISLETLYRTATVSELAALLGRTERSIRNKAHSIGIAADGRREWTTREVAALRSYRFGFKGEPERFAKQLMRTKKSVVTKAYHLRAA